MSLPERPRFHKLLTGLLVVLFCSAVYLFVWPQPNIFYAGVVVLHVAVGLLTTILLAITLWRRLRQETAIARLGWALLVAGAALGLVLIYTGTPRSDWNWLYLHILLCTAGVGFLYGPGRTGSAAQHGSGQTALEAGQGLAALPLAVEVLHAGNAGGIEPLH